MVSTSSTSSTRSRLQRRSSIATGSAARPSDGVGIVRLRRWWIHLPCTVALACAGLLPATSHGDCLQAWNRARAAIEARADAAVRLAALDEALRQCTGRAEQSVLQTNRGDALEELGNRDQALQAYRTATRLDPLNVIALLSLGDLHWGDSDCEGTCLHYGAALALEPEIDEQVVERYASCRCPQAAKGIELDRAADLRRTIRALLEAAKLNTRKGSESPGKLIVNFTFNSTSIADEERDYLGAVASAISGEADSIARVDLHGHGCDIGTDAQNMQVSRERAEAVRQLLVAGGVSADRIEVHAWGRGQPLMAGHSEAARWRNRRVEVMLTARR